MIYIYIKKEGGTITSVLQLSEKQLKTEPHQRSFFLRDGVLNLNSATLLLR